MSAAAFLRAKKLKGPAIVLTAARHNLREIQAELGTGGSIDPARTHHNSPRRRQKHHGLNNVEVTSTLTPKAMRCPAPQPPDPTAQLELLLPMSVTTG